MYYTTYFSSYSNYLFLLHHIVILKWILYDLLLYHEIIQVLFQSLFLDSYGWLIIDVLPHINYLAFNIILTTTLDKSLLPLLALAYHLQ